MIIISFSASPRQDVDIDRAMLFPDCPSSTVGPQLFKERKEAYDAYRARVALGLASRNAMVATAVSRVATEVLQSALHGLQGDSEVEEQKWIKTACLLSALERRNR